MGTTMRRITMLAAIAGLAFTTAAMAAPMIPTYVKAAVADPHRPAKQVALDAERKPADMVVFAGIKPGDTVVDLMPGGGYFTRIFAKVVGPKGHVYAYQPTEQDRFFKNGAPADKIAADPAYANVSVIHKPLAQFATPTKVDVVWTSQNYHDIHNVPDAAATVKALNTGIYNALRPGGVYIVLDHRAKAGTGTAETKRLHRIDPAAVKTEVEAAGFKYTGESNVLANPKDDLSLIVFDPKIRHHTDQFIFEFEKPKM